MEIAAAVIVSRWLGLAAAALLFGAPSFLIYGSRQPAPWMRPFMIAASAGGLCAALLALPVAAAQMSGDAAYAADPETIRAVIFETYFGAIWQIRFGLVMAACAAAWLAPTPTAWRLQAAIGALLVASLAWLGHGGEGGIFHRLADAVHALTASAWIGALAVLTTMRLLSANATSLVFSLRRFSGVGPAIVAVLVLTGVVNAFALFGARSPMAAFSTDYGLLLLAKIGLFALMLVFAAANRFWLTKRLDGPSAVRAARMLQLSLIAETTLAALVLATVAALGALEPPSAA